ncbi:hypothetical protein BIW11_12505, partial [Tropilaelaps mercedesae]
MLQQLLRLAGYLYSNRRAPVRRQVPVLPVSGGRHSTPVVTDLRGALPGGVRTPGMPCSSDAACTRCQPPHDTQETV